MKEEDESLEKSGVKKPDLSKFINELQDTQADCSTYVGRMAQCRAWWLDEWVGQTVDGRRWGANTFPWQGCSDSRLRIVDTIVKEHVTLCLAAFWSAKKQAKSIRPFASGRDVNMTQRMLDWRMDMMKRELLQELPMALAWRFGYGLAFLKIEWEQMRELIHVPITLDMIGELSAAMGAGSEVVQQILNADKAFDDELVQMLQSLSPVLATDEARTILNDLRSTGQSQLPVASLRVNKPKWSAKRAYHDILFPSETSNIQQTRFINERELVNETELTDRIVTDGYDADFVDECLKHKGVFADWYMPNEATQGSNRDLVELHHFLSWKLHDGTPCLYRTVFNQSVAGDELYALHRKFEYDHGQYPFVALRRSYLFRPLLSSIGIAEESYTDELDVKVQQDGLNNRTELIHQPPMIVPTLRAQAVAQSYGPRSIMTAVRPESVVFPPLPPMDQTPVIVMQMVQERLDRRYAIIGGAVDPEIKALRRQQLSTEVLGEFELALDQTVQLQQQFETDEDVQKVAGGEPWNYTRQDIQGQYEISAAVDINLVDKEVASMKLDMLAKLMPFKQAGGVVFKAAAQIIDPDLADALAEDEMSPVAQERERSDEYNAVAQIMGGIEPVQNLMANAQFRLSILQQIVTQPQFMQELQNKPNSQKMLENRAKAYQNQITQYQSNPQIGRSLSTQTFNKSLPPAQAMAPAQ